MKLKTAISLIVIAAFGAGLAACGGGSVSTGGAGGTGGTGASSSLVVKAPQTADAFDFQSTPQQGSRLASAISEFLISNALAQAGEDVYLLDSEGDLVATGVTDGSGQVIFPVSAGDYFICIGAPSLLTGVCTETTQAVGDDQVVIVTLGTDLVPSDEDPAVEEEVLIISSVVVESAADNIVAFQDPEAAHKTLVCHKGKFTISVGTPAAQNGHMAHGDSLGACPANELDQSAEGDSLDDNGGNNGNNGNGNGNNGNGNGNNQNS